jgi:hypothetical protein
MIVVWIVLGVLVCLLLGGLLWTYSGRTIYDPHGSGIIESILDSLEAEPAPPEGTLVIASCHLAYGLGPSALYRPAPEMCTIYDRLDHVIEALAASEADIALVHEADFASQRTYDIDQLAYIAAALGWGYAARTLTWECRYVPWPVHRPIGRVRGGIGVISRYPLVQNTRRRLPHVWRAPPFLAHLGPRHTVQLVDVQCGTHSVRLVHAHMARSPRGGAKRQVHPFARFVQDVATPATVLLGLPESATSPLITTLTQALQERMRLVLGADATSTLSSGCAFVGTGLQALEIRTLQMDIPVSDHPLMTLHLRWALPVLSLNGKGHRARA